MSKQAEAKTAQGYQDKPTFPTCANCSNFRRDFEEHMTVQGTRWTKETNLRCGIGGFKVKKLGTCDEHPAKKQESPRGQQDAG